MGRLRSPALREGTWRLLPIERDPIVAFDWTSGEERLLVVVNYGEEPTSHAVRDLSGSVRLLDPDGWRAEQRAGPAFDLDLPGWGARVIETGP